MEDYKEQPVIRCLECGVEINYGRSDKKFCCRGCKDTYNNRIKMSISSYRIRVDSVIHTNYSILNNLLKLEIDWVPLTDAAAAGFRSGFVTAYSKVGDHFEYCCYDISFRISLTRIFNIHRLSLNLPPKQKKHDK